LAKYGVFYLIYNRKTILLDVTRQKEVKNLLNKQSVIFNGISDIKKRDFLIKNVDILYELLMNIERQSNEFYINLFKNDYGWMKEYKRTVDYLNSNVDEFGDNINEFNKRFNLNLINSYIIRMSLN
jgi:hypothetical protein